MIVPITPKNITKEIRDFCNDVSPGESPAQLLIQPASKAISGECFPNVNAQIKKLGGSLQHGWKITQILNLILEAEFHGVWISPEGKTIDITPDPVDTRSLFIPDRKAKYEYKQVDSIRRPLVNDPLVHEYIAVHKNIFEIMNRGALAYQTGKVRVNNNEYQQNLMRLGRILHLLEPPIGKVGRNDPCPCGSGSKFKKCCGKDM